MKTVLITYNLPGKPPRQGITEQFVGAANDIFKGLPGLMSKQFCYDETTGDGHSVYLWETAEQAEEFFSPDFDEHFREVFGVDPTISFLDTRVLVDNRAGDVVVNRL